VRVSDIVNRFYIADCFVGFSYLRSVLVLRVRALSSTEWDNFGVRFADEQVVDLGATTEGGRTTSSD
jgi:hypothetical protein